ncbi:MAG: magnesium transporter, partial [Planctomycetes bacterium]|nr:magnesium transporter [Planctomycetota bacterium]
KLLGIITHDDIIDVVHDEAVEDAHLSAAVDPLDVSYLKTHLLTLSWKRGIWLIILFFCALLTALALKHYQENLEKWIWLMPFIPLVISTGGNCGNQSATLIITALTRGHIKLSDWGRVVRRELLLGLLLGSVIGVMSYVPAGLLASNWRDALVLPLTIVLVVVCGTLCGSLLPLLFKRLGLDPAMMSNPFVAGIIDILGIVIYMNVAFLIL